MRFNVDRLPLCEYQALARAHAIQTNGTTTATTNNNTEP
jgi:hypothetical protein